MRTIDRILRIINAHPNGLTNLQILEIMYVSDNETQEVRSQRITTISIRCRRLEKQGFVRCERHGRVPTWYPVEK